MPRLWGRQHVVGVGKSDDAGGGGDVVAGEPIGIAGAVEMLVVMAGDFHRHLPEGVGVAIASGDRFERVGADGRVGLEHHDVFRPKRAIGAKDVIGQRDGADVVQQGADSRVRWKASSNTGARRGLSVPVAPQRGVLRHARQMSGGFAGAGFDDFREGEHQGVAGLHQIAVAGSEILFQFGVDAQELAVERFGTLLGRLVNQGGLDAGHQLPATERLGQVIVRPQREHLRHLIGGDSARHHDHLQMPARRLLAQRRSSCGPVNFGMSMSRSIRSKSAAP